MSKHLNGDRKNLGWPPIRLTTCLCILLLSALCWYPSFNSITSENERLALQKQRMQTQNQKRQSLLALSHQAAWLEEYAWLTWQAETQRADLKGAQENSRSPLLLYISLQGVSSYSNWMLVLNKLFDQYALRPRYEQIYWLETGLVDMNLELQLVPKKLAIDNYQPLPRRGYKTWPENIEVLAALKWQDKRVLQLRVEAETLSLEQGDWVPALGATVTSLDADRAVFRKQSLSSNLSDKKATELVLNYLSPDTSSDVNLTLNVKDLNPQISAAELAFQSKRLADDS